VAIANSLYGPLIGSGLRKSRDNGTDKMLSLAGRLPRWYVLSCIGAIGLIGLIAISVPTLLGLVRWETIPRDIGVALLISLFVAAILAFTIDRWAKEELREDVIKATLNALIIPEFHSELQRIFHYEFLCDSHLMRISIRRVNVAEVRVTTSTERRLLNISGRPIEIPGSIHIDEWGFESNKSSIDQCSIEDENNLRTEDEFRTFSPNAYSIKAETKSITVPHGKHATVRSVFSEIRRTNDHIIATFSNPTKNPIVEVEIDEALEYEFYFGRSLSPGERIEHSQHMRVHRLIGMYFPGVYMKARWWPKGWSTEANA
jgi:hypothetical protein